MAGTMSDGYKPVLYKHLCPHGKDCFGGRAVGKGHNWAVLVLGGKDVDGCRECYEAKQACPGGNWITIEQAVEFANTGK
jgi:hypothetical protein